MKGYNIDKYTDIAGVEKAQVTREHSTRKLNLEGYKLVGTYDYFHKKLDQYEKCTCEGEFKNGICLDCGC